MANTPRGRSLVENLNSRLRTCFTLRSRHAERQGKSPREPMASQRHPHWLTLLGLGPLQPQRA